MPPIGWSRSTNRCLRDPRVNFQFIRAQEGTARSLSRLRNMRRHCLPGSAIQFAGGPLQDALRVGRAGPLPTHKPAEATAVKTELSLAKGASAETFYNAACVFALSAATPSLDLHRADQYGARAVELSHKAVAKGYRNVEAMSKDDGDWSASPASGPISNNCWQTSKERHREPTPDNRVNCLAPAVEHAPAAPIFGHFSGSRQFGPPVTNQKRRVGRVREAHRNNHCPPLRGLMSLPPVEAVLFAVTLSISTVNVPPTALYMPPPTPGAVGLVLRHQGKGQRQGRDGVVVQAAAQAGAAAVADGLVAGQGAAVHRGRGRRRVADHAQHHAPGPPTPPLAVAAAAPLGHVVFQRAGGDGDRAGASCPKEGEL